MDTLVNGCIPVSKIIPKSEWLWICSKEKDRWVKEELIPKTYNLNKDLMLVQFSGFNRVRRCDHKIESSLCW